MHLSADGDGEGRSRDVLVGELEVDDVEAGLGRAVGDVQPAVLVVLAFDLGLQEVVGSLDIVASVSLRGLLFMTSANFGDFRPPSPPPSAAFSVQSPVL